MTQEEYLKDSSKCPRCRGNSIAGTDSGFDGNYSWYCFSCNDCKFDYQDEYKLIGYSANEE